jgi:uncharacterized membrane protein
MSGPAPTETRTSRRFAYIDWARGIAVLLMIEAHTVDAWTRVSARQGVVYRDAVVLGGFAAPLFLWLAGLAAVLAAAAAVRRGSSRADAAATVCRRGLEIFILAFLFRLQAFIVSPGGHPITLFRVDILNIMGPASAAAGLCWLQVESPTALAALYGCLTAAIAMAAPLVRTMTAIDRLPIWMQWYLRPAAEHTTFTAFPWAGFVFAGAALGVLLANVRQRRGELHAGVALAGVTLAGIGLYTASLPALYAQTSFWTSSPTYFAIRVGVMMAAFAALYAAEQAANRAGLSFTALERFGRRSLFVYWIHVELVYGYASWPLRRALPLWGVGIAFVVFTAVMYGAVVLFERWRLARPQMTLHGKVQPV